MASFRTFSEVVATMLERLRLVQPNLDTKPGTVSRDLFVDIQADQIDRLYRTLAAISEKQSLASTSGADLDMLASNFGITRTTGALASGVVIFATNSISTDILIPSGTLVRARNGVSFSVIGNYAMTPFEKGRFAATANRLRKSLNIAGINSKYAIEVPVQATRPGTAGNVASLQVIESGLGSGVSLGSNVNVVNLTALFGGSNVEVDSSFRARILSIFGGSNTGTSSGYRSAAFSTSGVLDAIVVEPGSTLMLRDGTETIELDGGENRILSSGTGGKVDIYILGKVLAEASESFIYTDLSGTGGASDERNDVILGQAGQDPTRTSSERRVLAFKSGSLPLQPVDSMTSVVGSQSGVFAEESIDEEGIASGNYRLVKDVNPETGGSPFGFDSIHFISGEKEVLGEIVSKPNINSADALRYTDMSSMSNIYQDIRITGENSSVSIAGRDFVQLNHFPVTAVSSIKNKTTGETYILKRGIDDLSSGPTDTGLVKIEGRSLPGTSDILESAYTWRKSFDKYIDYDHTDNNRILFDSSKADVIDWSLSNGMHDEASTIEKTEDGIEYIVSTEYPISRIVSVHSLTSATATVGEVSRDGVMGSVGMDLGGGYSDVKNIESVVTSTGMEVYNTRASDGGFASNIVYLPSDSPVVAGDAVTVSFNKIELFDIEGGNGAFSSNTVTLPSEDILSEAGVLTLVDESEQLNLEIFVKYVAEIQNIIEAASLGSLPVIGSDASNSLFSAAIEENNQGIQPIFFKPTSGDISRFGPAQLSVIMAAAGSPGKIKIAGTTLTRLDLNLTAGLSMDGLDMSLRSELESLFGGSIPEGVGVARVDSAQLLSSDMIFKSEYDIAGSKLQSAKYSPGSSAPVSSMEVYAVILPSTPNNSLIVASSGDVVRVSVLIYNNQDTEELYFSGSGAAITNKRFGRISRVSVSSGFRASTGLLSGSVSIYPMSQPESNDIYYVDYSFVAPKEGERITISYNVNDVISSTTSAVESVRPITADVLVKSAEELSVDVSGTIMINENYILNVNSIIEDVANNITNILSSSRLGSVIDYSDLISSAAAVKGVDSVDISMFNESGLGGRKSFIKALDNQYISPGSVLFEAVLREEFRIS
jgi:phage-related baseplate assembly protein